MNRSVIFLVSLLCLALASCTSVQVSSYAGQQPRLIMEEFFNGRLTAHGVLKNWRGRVTRYFNADILAYWQDGTGTLEEDFVFNDGQRQRRVWTLQPVAAGGYRGTAGDVIGTADVQVAGNSVFLDYVLRIPRGDGYVDIRIDDRMYLVAPGVLINESAMSKFGLPVGEIQLVISKAD